MIAELAALLAAPALADSFFRTVLFVSARRAAGAERRASTATFPLIVVIPARDEGRFVRATLESVRNAAVRHPNVKTVLLLDGRDDTALAVASELSVEAVVKEPAGPTKARALQWFAAHPVLRGAEAVLILDVGSIVAADFFDRLTLDGDSAAAQAILRGEGGGVGQAAASSEAVAQMSEDRGREALQWSVRLRGTGSLLRRDAFEYVVPRQVTQVEDLEWSLLLAAAGYRITLMHDCLVYDEKPRDVASAAAQRARWIVGRYALLFRHSAGFVRLIVRRPLEGVAFLAEIFGRPLALTSLLRLAAAIVIFVHGRGWIIIVGALLLASAAADIAAHVRSPAAAAAAARLVIAWLRAIALAPRALFKWMRAKRS